MTKRLAKKIMDPVAERSMRFESMYQNPNTRYKKAVNRWIRYLRRGSPCRQAQVPRTVRIGANTMPIVR